MQLETNNLLKSELAARLCKTPAQGGPDPEKSFDFFANVSENAVIASAATLSDASSRSNSSLCRKLQKQDRPCSQELARVPLRSLALYQQLKTLLYLHYFVPAVDVAKTLASLLTSVFYG